MVALEPFQGNGMFSFTLFICWKYQVPGDNVRAGFSPDGLQSLLTNEWKVILGEEVAYARQSQDKKSSSAGDQAQQGTVLAGLGSHKTGARHACCVTIQELVDNYSYGASYK